MAKKLNSMPDYIARMPKQPHDVSQSTTFTQCPGQLLPVYHDMLHHGDEIHFRASQFTRLQPLTTAAMMDCDIHLDYFFVPLTVMYTPSSSMFYQTDDFVSSLVRDNLIDENKVSFPVHNFKSFLQVIAEDRSGILSRPVHLFTLNENQFTILPPSAFDCFGKSLFRIWDMLDMASQSLLAGDGSAPDMFANYPNYTPWFALAYQAIYQLYYRNDDREPKNYHYNIDKYVGVPDFVEELSSTFSSMKKTIFNINYATRPKDYFNSVKVSPIGSSVSMLSAFHIQSGSSNPYGISALYGSVNKWLNSDSVFKTATSANGFTTDDSEVVNITPFSRSTQNVVAQLNNTNRVRQLFMVDKLLRVIGRTEKNYESQFLAHYGIKVPHDVMHNITHIGHDVASLRPTAVVSQSDTWNGSSGSALGEVGGQGSQMLRSSDHTFKAPFHGVFMCISHIVPRVRYSAGLSKLHQLNSPNDFWIPEFDKKGMQPIFRYEAYFGHSGESYPTFDVTTRFGWQFAYEQFKRKFDRISMAYTGEVSPNQVNTYSPWVVSSRPYGSMSPDGRYGGNDESLSLSADRLLVSPTSLNGIMQVPYSPAWSDAFVAAPWLIYHTDPFLCDFNMYCKKVNGMSEYGEPEL